MNEHDIQSKIRLDFSLQIPDEIWRPVVGFRGRYEVSNLGRVRFLPQKGNHFTQGIMKTVVHRDGYIVLSIVDNNGKRYCKKMHRLVAEAFIPREIGKNIVHHKDSVKTNNHFSNLEWTTILNNTRHALRDGLLCGNHYISPERRKWIAQIGREKCSRPVVQVDSNGKVITHYPSVMEASRSTGIRRATIRNVCNGKKSQWNGMYWRYANA